MIPDAANGERFGAGGLNEGAPLPPPPHIVARRTVYQQEMQVWQQERGSAKDGPLTEPALEILVEADMLRTNDYESPRSTTVFSAIGRLEVKAALQEIKAERLAAVESARVAAEVAKAAEAASAEAKRVEAEEARAAAEAEAVAQAEAAKQAKTAAKAKAAARRAAKEEAKASAAESRRATPPPGSRSPSESSRPIACSNRDDRASPAALIPPTAGPTSSAGASRGEEPAVPISQSTMNESELRTKLKPIFGRFDSDGSGAVSSSEMAAILRELNMALTAEQLSTLMTASDPDQSGEIDFDEFVAALQVQMKDGGPGLASVFTTAASAWGWLNPFASWFGDQDTAPATNPSTPWIAHIPRAG